MTTTFHPFPLLPPELRLEIWRLAIRDTDVAGVNFVELDWHHTYSDRNSLQPTGCYNPDPGLIPATCGTEREPCGQCDHGDYNTRHRCLRKSKSSYLFDSGLWDACKESRAVMLGRFRGPKRQLQPEDEWDEAVWPAHATSAFISKGNSVRHFTMFPGRDLFFVESAELLRAAGGEKELCMDTCLDPKRHYLDDLQHFATRFNPVWDNEERQGSSPAYMQIWLTFAASLLKGDGQTLYIVDKRLVRRQEVPASSLLRYEDVFHASDGIYVDIEEEEEWCYSEDGKVTLNPPIFEFINTINDYVDQHVAGDSALISLLGWEPNIGKHIIPE